MIQPNMIMYVNLSFSLSWHLFFIILQACFTSCMQTILKCMHATDREIKALRDMAKKLDGEKKPSPQKTVTFGESNVLLTVTEYFSCFNLEFDLTKSKSLSTSSADAKIKLNLKSDNASNLGKRIPLAKYATNTVPVA